MDNCVPMFGSMPRTEVSADCRVSSLSSSLRNVLNLLFSKVSYGHS